MIALSIRQPWAWLILHAGKDIENRCWATKFRGRVLVHAGKGCTQAEYDNGLDDAFAFGVDVAKIPGWKQIERGGVVGSVEIIDCVTESESPWFCGDYGFVLMRPKVLPFAEFKGMLGLFNVPREVLLPVTPNVLVNRTVAVGWYLG